VELKFYQDLVGREVAFGHAQLPDDSSQLHLR
jgi:hypothetical protein